jgi:hypothetical protein
MVKLEGGGAAELVAHLSQRSEDGIAMLTNVSLECWLFEFMMDEKYQIIHVSYVFGTSDQFKMVQKLISTNCSDVLLVSMWWSGLPLKSGIMLLAHDSL